MSAAKTDRDAVIEADTAKLTAPTDAGNHLIELHAALMSAVRWIESGDSDATKAHLLDALVWLDHLCHELGYQLAVAPKDGEVPNG